MMIEDFRKILRWANSDYPDIVIIPDDRYWLNVHWQFTGSQYVLADCRRWFSYGGWPFLKGWVDDEILEART
jgi:Cu2+-exporting ATPase